MSEPTPAATPTDDRQKLRLEMLARRKALPPAERSACEAHIQDHLLNLLARLKPCVLGFYWPFAGEVDVRPAVIKWLSQASHHQAALPVIAAPDAPLCFHAWLPEAEMAPGRFGIPVPSSAVSVTPDVLLIPLVAVDRAGFRLGMGGGYYDRTLNAFKPRPQAVGLGFEFQKRESILRAPWDQALDWVVSEAGVIRTAHSPGPAPAD